MTGDVCLSRRDLFVDAEKLYSSSLTIASSPTRATVSMRWRTAASSPPIRTANEFQCDNAPGIGQTLIILYRCVKNCRCNPPTNETFSHALLRLNGHTIVDPAAAF